MGNKSIQDSNLSVLIITLSTFIMAASAAMMISCSSNENIPAKEKKEKPYQKMANPAASKCVNDGFELKPIMENGVTKEYLCINPATGKKCEVWKYYRGECSVK